MHRVRTRRGRRTRLAGGALLAKAAAFATCVLFVVACAKGTELLTIDDDGGVGVDDGGTTPDVFVIPSQDSAMPDTDSSPMPGNDSGTCTKKVVINEVRTDGTTASDEFVELYNSSSCAVSIASWQVMYEAAAGGTALVKYKAPAGTMIASNAYFVLGASGFSGTKNDTLTSGLKDTDGQVGLTDDTGKVIDAVAYGTVTGGDYREGQSAPSPVSGKSIGRMPNGTDTDKNSADFKGLTASSPGAAN
jgi:hypothetical protein